MAIVCPTVTAQSEAQYKNQLDRVVPLARRLHLDFMDGEFAPVTSLPLDKAWWPTGMQIDLHVMFQRPAQHIAQFIRLRPRLVIVHAEADGDFYELSQKLQAAGIKIGLALLQQTSVDKIASVLPTLDHVLIFSGDLGHFGGTAEMSLLNKVRQIKSAHPALEVGWDGGINERNIESLVAGGVDVLNVGGFIQKADNPVHAYATLKEAITKKANRYEKADR